MYKRIALLAIGSLGFLGGAFAADGPYVEGTHYKRIEPAQPTFAAPGKVEVVEVFSYACHACDAAQPAVDRWKKTMAPNVEFSYLPAVFFDAWALMARSYFVAKALKILDKTHQPTLDANFKLKQPLNTVDDVAKLYSQFGVTPEAIKKAMTSFGVEAEFNRAKKRVMAYGVSSTPTIVVHGKWRVNGSGAVGGFDEMFKVVDHLVQMEAAQMQAKR